MKINSTYLEEDVIEQMIDFYNQNGYLQIQEFFTELPELLPQKKKEIYNPLYEKKTQAKILVQKEIIDFIEDLLSTKIKIEKYLEYKHKDYIILNDKKKLENGFDIIIDFTPKWKKEWGGTLTYTDGESELFYLEPQHNTLTIIGTDSGLKKYLKYINNKAEENKIKRIEISA